MMDNRKKSTITLSQSTWEILDRIGPSRGKAVDKLIDYWRINTMIDLKNGIRFGKSDPLNFVIEKAGIVVTGKNAGNIVWKQLDYYGTLKSCCKGLLQHCVDTDDINTINQLSTQLSEIEQRIIQVAGGGAVRNHIVGNGKVALLAAIDKAMLTAARGNGKKVEFSDITYNRGWHKDRICDSDWSCNDCLGCQRITIDDHNFLVSDIDGDWSFYNNSDSPTADGDLEYCKRFATAHLKDEMVEEGEPHIFRFLNNKCTYTVLNSLWALSTFRQKVEDDDDD